MARGRFIFHEENGFAKGTKIITDTETGVQYLFANWGNAGGLAVFSRQERETTNRRPLCYFDIIPKTAHRKINF